MNSFETAANEQPLSDVWVLKRQILSVKKENYSWVKLRFRARGDLRPRGRLTKPGEKDALLTVDTKNAWATRTFVRTPKLKRQLRNCCISSSWVKGNSGRGRWWPPAHLLTDPRNPLTQKKRKLSMGLVSRKSKRIINKQKTEY